MPQEFSFDVVSEFDRQELINAIDQTTREVTTRYDLKDSGSELELGVVMSLIGAPFFFVLLHSMRRKLT